jgi:phage terminase small subunit
VGGRPFVPTPLKVLNGTENPSRRNEREPHLPPHIPEPPAHLSPEEFDAWRRFGELLEPMRCATDQDAAAFEMLVVAFVQHQRLAAALREAKTLVYGGKRPDGSVMLRTRPELTALGDVGRRLLILLGRFGLTPADRARVVQLSEDGADPFDEFAR